MARLRSPTRFTTSGNPHGSLVARRYRQVSPIARCLVRLHVRDAGSLASPFSYQTNMFVYGPGGYPFSDYLRAGLPLNLLLWIVAILVIPLIWPLN